MFKIGIEAHTIEKEERLGAGGNYLLNLLKEWSKLDPDEYQFILYFKDRIPSEEPLKSPVFVKKLVKIPLNIKSTALFYNLFLPLKAKLDKLDILFLPFYMRPFFYFSPTITTVHDISFKVHPEWSSWNYKLPFRLLTWLAIKTSKAILSCSEYTKKEILKHYKVDPDKIKIIYLAANEEYDSKKDLKKIGRIKQKYGLTKKYLFYTGTIFNRRHILESIKAFEILKRSCPEFAEGYQFLISGRDFTKPSQNIDKETEKIQAIKRVRFVDYEDLVFVYQGAELFVWLSEYEGFGLPVLEAMASKTPVLTTKMTSLSEIIGDYPIYIEDPNNINEIKEKMEQMLFNENLRKAAIEKGLFQAQNFSWQKTAEQTLKVIENEINTH